MALFFILLPLALLAGYGMRHLRRADQPFRAVRQSGPAALFHRLQRAFEKPGTNGGLFRATQATEPDIAAAPCWVCGQPKENNHVHE